MSSDPPATGTGPSRTTDLTGAADREVVLAAEGVKKHFDQSDGLVDKLLGAGGAVKAVDGVDLEVREGETLAVVGESGCGKSTLGETLLNLQTATAGTIRYRGEDITGWTGRKMRPYRSNLQMIFQDPLASLNPRQTVGEIITTPMKVHDTAETDELEQKSQDLLELVGLEPAHVDRYPAQFSGGQQQRVGIARALSVEPELIIADEPVSALDVSVQAQIINLLENLQAELGLSLLFITHDLSVVRHIADRVAVMYLGEIVEIGDTQDLFENPQHPYTKSLLSAVPRIDPATRTDRTILSGTVPSPIDPPSGCRFHTRCPAVIPPEDWRDSQAAFRAVFEFRNRILDGAIDPDAAAKRIGHDSEDAIADHLIERSLNCDIETLSPDVSTTVLSAARKVAAGDTAEAAELVRDAFTSPCETQRPERSYHGSESWASCHRVDDTAPGTAEID